MVVGSAWAAVFVSQVQMESLNVELEHAPGFSVGSLK